MDRNEENNPATETKNRERRHVSTRKQKTQNKPLLEIVQRASRGSPLRIRNRYCQFPSNFVFFCARARSVLATRRKLAERFVFHLVELFDRHWRSQVRTESFDKVGKESLRQLSTHSPDGFCASAKKRGLTRKMDSTGSGPKRRQPRPGKGEEEGEGKNGPTPQKAVLCETIL